MGPWWIGPSLDFADDSDPVGSSLPAGRERETELDFTNEDMGPLEISAPALSESGS